MYLDTAEEAETEVNGYEGPCEFNKAVGYLDTVGNAVDISQLIPLVDAATTCRQLVRWRCRNAIINSASNALTYWRNRNGDAMAYFGNATARSAGRCEFSSYAIPIDDVVVGRQHRPSSSTSSTSSSSVVVACCRSSSSDVVRRRRRSPSPVVCRPSSSVFRRRHSSVVRRPTSSDVVVRRRNSSVFRRPSLSSVI